MLSDGVAVTDEASELFGPEEKTEVLLQNAGLSAAFIEVGGVVPVANESFRLAAGEAINTRHLPQRFIDKADTGFKAICATGEATTVIWTQ